MALLVHNCSFISFLLYLTINFIGQVNSNNEFTLYQIDDNSKSTYNLKEDDIILLSRNKRYVETPIPRLADNYYHPESAPAKHLDKDDLDTFSRRRGRMEMIGNLAVNSDDLAAATSHAHHHQPSQSNDDKIQHDEVTEKLPEKSTKKSVAGYLYNNKKNPENFSEKTTTSIPLEENVTYEQTINNNHNQTLGTTINGNNNTFSIDNNQNVTNHHENSTANRPISEKTQDLVNNGNKQNVTDTFSETDYPKDITNNTLLKNNITKQQEDHNAYYNSTFIVDSTIAKQYWIDMDKVPDVVVNKILSKSHRRASTVSLSFKFPFYGHLVQKVTIATGGFLYTGDFIHSWLAATQYIAPLMGNFDTGISENSQVRYMDNGTAFIVQWDRVHLQDKPEAGQFTFQTILHDNGDIVFVYKDVPILVENIQDDQHPVKVGLSDAYIIDKAVFFVRKKTIYEYHRVNFKGEDIKNWTVIYMTALPTCLTHTDCKSCVNMEKKTTKFNCKWCPAVNRCSTGTDRYKQEWTLQQCEHNSVNNSSQCNNLILNNNNFTKNDQHQTSRLIKPNNNNVMEKSSNNAAEAVIHTIDTTNNEQNKKSLGHSGLIGSLFFILAVSGLGLWILYAYRNPHTASGQVLIKYRPSQWTLRRGEARYTAATIHM